VQRFSHTLKISGLLILLFLFLFTGCSSKVLKKPEGNKDFVVIAEQQAEEISEIDSLSGEKKNISIEQMIANAKKLCNAKKYSQADSILKKIVSIIEHENEDNEDEWLPVDDYLNEVIKIYSEDMPPDLDISDDIAALVFQKQMFTIMDSIKFTSEDSIIISRMFCRKNVQYDIPMVWNDRVLKAMYYYVHSRKETVSRWFIRSAQYLPFMKKMFAENNLPIDLAYLPLIESGFNPSAYSPARASGIWQFISTTGQLYGLRHTYWIDERRDPVKSTIAAVNYLRKLFNDFNDWHLALAAYNCGEGGLGRAITRSDSKNYWQLTLPKETMNYVPSYLAALTIAKNPDCFGFASDGIKDTFSLDTVLISECIDFNDIANGIGVGIDTLRKINPHILHWCTPPDISNVTLYLPSGYAQNFKNFYSSLPAEKKVKWYRYKVKSGDNISSIAHKFNLPVDAIRTVNRMKNNRIIAGRYLFIPFPSNGSDVETQKAFNKIEVQGQEQEKRSIPKNEQNSTHPENKIRYSVKQGDTVWELASLFGVSAEDICKWNNLTMEAQIKAGDILSIYTEKNTVPISRDVTKFSEYKVQKGDTPYSISRKFNMILDDLLRINNLDTEKPEIFIGQVIRVGVSNKGASQSKEPIKNLIKYVISPGENLFRISKNFSIPLETLLRINNLSKDVVIRPGDTLLVPQKYSDQSKSGHIVLYKVKEGDNLWTIAASFGVDIKKLEQINNLSSDSVIMPGKTIKVVLAEGM
jgi:membrane-bound lytic murein transglycosylase D